jgi:DNA-binding MurR/RpiR family transcriptional regulator
MDREDSALKFRIRNLLSELSRSEAVVAEYILNHSDEVIKQSVSALADCCGVSEPTVIRACRTLGFSGYQAMKIALIQNAENTIEYSGEEVTAGDSMAAAAQKVFGAANDALNLTKNSLDIESMEKAADMLLKAERILVFGVGGSAAVAADVQHKFLRLGLRAQALSDPNMQTISAAYAGDRDVVFAISHSGSSKAVVDNARLAAGNGAGIISLSSMGKSPLTELADVSLFTAANETRYRIVAISSRIAELTIIDTLYSYLSFRTAHSENLKIEKAIEDQMY